MRGGTLHTGRMTWLLQLQCSIPESDVYASVAANALAPVRQLYKFKHSSDASLKADKKRDSAAGREELMIKVFSGKYSHLAFESRNGNAWDYSFWL